MEANYICKICRVEITLDNLTNHHSECPGSAQRFPSQMFVCCVDECSESFATDDELSLHSRKMHWGNNAAEETTSPVNNQVEEFKCLENSVLNTKPAMESPRANESESSFATFQSGLQGFSLPITKSNSTKASEFNERTTNSTIVGQARRSVSGGRVKPKLVKVKNFKSSNSGQKKEPLN